MKAKEIKKIVNKEIKAGNHDKEAIAMILLKEGASLASAQNMIRKCFKDAGLTKTTSKTVLATIAEEIADDADTAGIETYKDMREMAESYADAHNVNVKSVMKIIKKQLEKEGRDVPRRINLGVVKEEIVTYFLKNEETSIKGLAELLVERHDMDEERALRIARSNYTFAYMLYHHLDPDEVN